MPELFRFFGFVFFFYSREHEPPHVHVGGNGGLVIFDYVNGEFVIRKCDNIKAADLRKIKQVLVDNTDIILNRWNEYFGK